MTHKAHDIGVSKHVGTYSDAIEVVAPQRWLFTSGTPGLTDDGKTPQTFEEQARRAWAHIFSALDAARMTTADLVKVNTTIVNADDIHAYVKIRRELLRDVKPAFMLSVVNQLVKPGLLVEIEVIAATNG